MNVINRIKKLEKQRKPRVEKIIWNFEKTTNEQLMHLKSLLENGETEKATEFNQQLIKDGFLSYRIIEV